MKVAKATEQTAIYNLCEGMLDTITLMRDDHQRLNKAIDHKLFNVSVLDIRAFIDELPDLEVAKDV